MADEMTDRGRLPDIHLVMDFALLSTAFMTGPLMTGVPRVSAVPEITAPGQALQTTSVWSSLTFRVAAAISTGRA